MAFFTPDQNDIGSRFAVSQEQIDATAARIAIEHAANHRADVVLLLASFFAIALIAALTWRWRRAIVTAVDAGLVAFLANGLRTGRKARKRLTEYGNRVRREAGR